MTAMLMVRSMNNFPRNRYESDELLTLFDQAKIQEEIKGTFYKLIEIDGVGVEIYLPTSKDGSVDRKDISRARSVLVQINELDNYFQDMCELSYKKYEKSGSEAKDWIYYLSHIEITESEALFQYYAMHGYPSEWVSIFRENDSGNWERVNL